MGERRKGQGWWWGGERKVGKRRSDCSTGADGVGTSRDGWMIDKSANGEGDGNEGLSFG
jgi:hypothetical protein